MKDQDKSRQYDRERRPGILVGVRLTDEQKNWLDQHRHESESRPAALRRLAKVPQEQ